MIKQDFKRIMGLLVLLAPFSSFAGVDGSPSESQPSLPSLTQDFHLAPLGSNGLAPAAQQPSRAATQASSGSSLPLSALPLPALPPIGYYNPAPNSYSYPHPLQLQAHHYP